MSDLTEVYVKPDECPACLYQCNSATAVTEKSRPSPRDISLCINCAAINVFDEKLNLMAATEDDLAELEKGWPDAYAEMRRAQALIRKLPRKRGKEVAG